MTQEELRHHCLSEIAKLKAAIKQEQIAINQRLGGIASYEDIIRQLDGTPDPGAAEPPANRLDSAG